MCRLLNCIREFTIGTIDDAGNDSFLCHIVSLPLLYECFVYVVVLCKGHPLLESICRLGYFVFVLWKKFAHVFAWPRDRLECVQSWIHCEKINIFLQFLTQCCNCWRRIQQVSCYNTNVDIKFSAHDAFLE